MIRFLSRWKLPKITRYKKMPQRVRWGVGAYSPLRNKIYLSKKYATTYTIIHEYGHWLIRAIFGYNKFAHKVNYIYDWIGIQIYCNVKLKYLCWKSIKKGRKNGEFTKERKRIRRKTC